MDICRERSTGRVLDARQTQADWGRAVLRLMVSPDYDSGSVRGRS
jgi:hypothetical protein